MFRCEKSVHFGESVPGRFGVRADLFKLGEWSVAVGFA